MLFAHVSIEKLHAQRFITACPAFKIGFTAYEMRIVT